MIFSGLLSRLSPQVVGSSPLPRLRRCRLCTPFKVDQLGEWVLYLSRVCYLFAILVGFVSIGLLSVRLPLTCSIQYLRIDAIAMRP